ncbi:glycoside hydrolase family 88 protein [Maribacter algarum]|uniref:Glycoside hydrolase family 88 protein n=1 Tax=Maribacter algarum (ex Zhang et al. 2020) TaxID=2578118 RepID=A0A5S3Q5L7_9FLAO|nr:glycoside hydrolase family 88 protein [Maribacter algarum]TMM52002.1 glycoside hydrolase family 88 protein [Maribacter algarum]
MKKNQTFRNLVTISLIGILCVYTVSAQQFNNKEIEKAMVRAMEWQEAHPIFAVAPTDWTNGAYQVGIARAHKTTQNQIFLAALKNTGYRNKWNTYDRYFHADDVTVSYGYLYLVMNDTRKNYVDLKPTETFIQKHLYEPNKWRDGTDKDPVKNILWWWCDALFMAPPMLTLYANHTGEMNHLDTMHKYYMETYNLLYNKEEHLFARDTRYQWKGNADDLKEENGKKIFWSRGNGWVLGGLALILDDMPKDYKHRDFYLNLYKEMAAKIKSIQPEDGLWRTSLLSPESFDHGEVSGSGFYTFALAWGINNGILDKSEYVSSVYKAWAALEKCQQDTGMVGWVQNIGADPQPASVDSWQNFGTGAFLLAGSEILKMDD